MKSIYVILLPILLAGVGCMTLPSLKDEPAPKAASPASPVANAPGSETKKEIGPPPVNADEVTDSNAREKAEALRRELSKEDK